MADSKLINDSNEIIQDTKLVSLNSKFAQRLNGTKNSRVLFDFINIIDKSKDNLFMTIAVQSAEIPASYYNVDSTNNLTKVLIGATTHDIDVPVGNYDADTYLAAFIIRYNTVTGATLTGSYSSTTGLFSLQDTANDITILGAGTTSFILWGGADGVIVNYVFLTAGTASSFPYPANFLGITKIKVCSDNLAGTNVDSSQLKTTTLIDTISATAIPFGLTIFNSLGRETFMKSKRIEEIDIQLKDQDDNLIDFNNAEWSMSFIINTHRRVMFREDMGRGIIVNDKFRKAERAVELVKKQGETEEELETLEFSELDDLL